MSNFAAHYTTTGPEIWRQSGGRVDAFVMGSGTGGTIAGVSRFLKEQNPATRVFLVDPQGSSLYNKVRPRELLPTPRIAAGAEVCGRGR